MRTGHRAEPPDAPAATPYGTAAAGLGLQRRLLFLALGAVIPPALVATMLPADLPPPVRGGMLVGAMGISFALTYLGCARIARALEALTIDERRYRLLFNANPLPMWAWDAETLHFLAVNDAAIETYGYPRERFLALRITDLLDPAERARFDGARLPLTEIRQEAGTWVHRTAAGRRLEMEVITTRSSRLGRATWLSVGIDVTVRRETERALARRAEQLHQAQKLEAIGTFASGISHDFRNLLTGILGYCDLLLVQQPTDSAVRADVGAIRNLALRGTELSRQILTASRRDVANPTVIDPNAAVRGLDRLLRRVIGEHIALRMRLDPAVGTVFADASQLEQALLNLVGNARDAMPQGGTLTIETARLDAAEVERLRLDAQQPWMAIRVRDTGAGMSAEMQQHIFEPFFTTKEAGKGTGLGLALASSVMQQNGGDIRVDSAPGEGTTMHLLLPRRTDVAPVAGTEPDEATEPPPGTETVLVVEDEAAVRAVAVAALERRGYRVLAAADGESALALARGIDGPLDLLVTDVIMPGIGGRELADRLTALRPGLPVLFVTGYTENAETLLALDDTTRSLLAKPFTPLDLVRHVRRAIDRMPHGRAPSD